MSKHAFFISDDKVIHIANPSGAGFQYRAQEVELFPGAQVDAQRLDVAETVLVVRAGTIDVMVNGAVGTIAAGSFVRIPPLTWFAYRNAGTGMARILSRTAPAERAREARRITIQIAAA